MPHQVSRPHDFIPYEAIMAEKNNHTQTEAVASFLQTASAIVKPPSASAAGILNVTPQRKMPAADVMIHFQKRARIIELAGLQQHPAMSPELLQVLEQRYSILKLCNVPRNFLMRLFLLRISGALPWRKKHHCVFQL
jgi:hypothetical protein